MDLLLFGCTHKVLLDEISKLAYLNYSKHRILSFWINFAQKGYFQSKIENLRKTTKFSIFELVYIPSFTSNRKFCFFEPKKLLKKLSKESILDLLGQIQNY